MILAGEVMVDGRMVDKAGTPVAEDSELEVLSRQLRYVSRGGFKLEGAIQDFALDFSGKVVLDVGASTGGFTDCALQNGAVRVYAVDVGYGQLDWKLRRDERVVNMERCNIRTLRPESIGQAIDIATMDVSFISTRLIFPVLKPLLSKDGIILSLIKPQFEAGREKVGKKGVVRDPLVHQEVLCRCIAAAAEQGLACRQITFSPLRGPEGNLEYFILLKPGTAALEAVEDCVYKVVTRAHHVLEAERR